MSRARGGVAWCGVVLALALPALVLRWTDFAHPGFPQSALIWQRSLLATQPWRLFTSAWVHGGPVHLGANLLGAVMLAALGLAAAVPTRLAWAWLAAWPLTQLGLLYDGFHPQVATAQLVTYGGASGVLHAGVAVLGVHLVRPAGKAHRQVAVPFQRLIGAALLLSLFAKVVADAPWQAGLLERPGLDVLVVPLAHLSGALCGVLCGAVCEIWEICEIAARQAAARRRM